jgi:hypothetical protein
MGAPDNRDGDPRRMITPPEHGQNGCMIDADTGNNIDGNNRRVTSGLHPGYKADSLRLEQVFRSQAGSQALAPLCLRPGRLPPTSTSVARP